MKFGTVKFGTVQKLVTIALLLAPSVMAVERPHQPTEAKGSTSKAVCAGPCDALPILNKKQLVVKGSTTVRPVTERTETLFELDKKIAVTVEAAGSTTGVRALLEGNCARLGGAACDFNLDGKIDAPTDIAASSRPATAAEKTFANNTGCCLVEQVVAQDGLGIIANSSNPICAAGSLTYANIRDAYTNPLITNWAQLGQPFVLPLTPYSRTTEGGTFGSFIDLYGVNRPLLLANPEVVFGDSNDELVEAVQADPGGIAYVGIAFSNRPGVCSVPVRPTLADAPIAASFTTVQNGSFYARRNLYYYTCGVTPENDERTQFLEYSMTRNGQGHVVEVGYVPAYGNNPAVTVALASLASEACELVAGDTDRIAEKRELIATSADPNVVAEAGFALNEWTTADLSLIDSLVDRAVGCAPGDRYTTEAQAHLASAVAAAAADDFEGANEHLQDACQAVSKVVK